MLHATNSHHQNKYSKDLDMLAMRCQEELTASNAELEENAQALAEVQKQLVEVRLKLLDWKRIVLYCDRVCIDAGSKH